MRRGSTGTNFSKLHTNQAPASGLSAAHAPPSVAPNCGARAPGYGVGAPVDELSQHLYLDAGPVLARHCGTVRFDALVLNAALRQSLVAVRSLGRRGLQVAAAGMHRNTPALSSRWCRQGFVFPSEEALGAYAATLDGWLERAGARVLIASNDATIALLRLHRARLEPRVRVALADERPLAIAINKERTLAVARRLGLHVP